MEVMARSYGFGEADAAWKVGRIMLKYRPIAPRPSTLEAVKSPPIDVKSSSGRGKRKGSSKEGKRGKKPAKNATGVFSEEKIISPSSNSSNNYSITPLVVTLPLMPVTPERKENKAEISPATTPSPTGSGGHVAVSYFRPPSWKLVGSTNDKVVSPRPVRPVGSWVTVECVTDTWQDGGVVRPADLEEDTCPVFFSDACGERVTWTNAAYKRMVVGLEGEEEEDEEEMKVALVTRGLVPGNGVTCFTCRVRVRYACRRRGKVSVAVPWDVWRMERGAGLAWRLDVKTALSLSLGC